MADLRSLAFNIDFRTINSSPIENANKAMDGIKDSMQGIIKNSSKVGKSIASSMKTSPVDKMRNATNKLKDKFKSATSESTKIGKAMESLNQTKAMQVLSKGMDNVAKIVVKTKDKFNNMNGALERIKKSRIGEKVGTSLSKIKGPADIVINKAKGIGLAFKNGVSKAKIHIRTLGKQLQDLQPKMEKVGKNLIKSVTTPIMAAGTAGAKMYFDIETGIKKISTLADNNILPVGKIEKEVRRISDLSGIAQTEISESIYTALSSGIGSADVAGFVESNINLTRAGFTDMDTAIDATTTVMNAYGDKAYEVDKIHDILVQTQNKGKITVDELGSSLGRIIPTASSLGVNMDQVGASYAMLTSKGQPARLATTNLNAMLEEMGTTGSKTDKALRSITGKSFPQLIDEGKSVGDILKIVDGASKDAGLSLKDMFGSGSAGSAAISLLGDGVEGDFNDYMKLMNNSSGLTAKTAEATESSMLKIKKATNKVKNALVDFGAMMAPTVGKAADKISTLVEKFNKLGDSTKSAIGKFALAAAAIGPVIWAISKIVEVAPLVGPALSGAFTFITGPVGIAIAAIIAVIAVIMHLWKTNEKFRDIVIEVFETIKTSIGTALEFINGLWDTYGESIKTTAMNLFEIVKGVVIIAMTIIATVIVSVLEVIKLAWAVFGSTVMSLVSVAWETITTVISGAMHVIQGVIDVVMGIITGNWGQAWEGMKQIFSGIFEALGGIAKGAMNGVISVINGALGGLNKIKVPDWVPGLGGKGINIPFIPKLAKGTDNWEGGIVQVHEEGGEIIDLPNGSRVYPHDKSVEMARNSRFIDDGKEGVQAIFNPIFNIELNGTATEKDKQDIEQIIERKSRELFNVFFKEMNKKMA